MNVPAIFSEDVNALVADMQAKLQTALGRTFAPSDIEMLLINAFCYQLQLYNITGNQAFRQNLVDFATGVMLDFLGALVGVTRLPPAAAVCTLQFNLVNGHAVVTIPAGTRVESIDGQVIFQTDADIPCPFGASSVTGTATAQTTGTAGNSYAAGDVSLLLDPQAYISTVQNIDATNSGGNAETDDELRARIKLAPSKFSVAGPAAAYVYWAKTASPTIVDVKCVTTSPGVVTLYPLCINGTLSSTELKQQILTICSADNIRPQNDTVLIDDPTVIEYSIEVNVTTYTGAIDATVEAAINSNLQAYVNTRINSLGVDVVVAQIIAQCVVDGVYDVSVTSLTGDIVVTDDQYAKCTNISVNITGNNNG